MPKFKYIYGPVYSWRLGLSLGIDLLARKNKICNFNCVYCQLGITTRLARKRKYFVPVKEVLKELETLPALKLDYLTFSGRGEPTLARNLGKIIKEIKKIRPEKIAVITNAGRLKSKEVRKELAGADFVLVKLDAPSGRTFNLINQPGSGIKFKGILRGIKQFRQEFKGKLGLQIMLIKENKNQVNQLIRLAKLIKPEEIQINTPLRDCPVRPLSKKEILKLKKYFTKAFKKSKVKIISVYDFKPRKIKYINQEDTSKRHGQERSSAGLSPRY